MNSTVLGGQVFSKPADLFQDSNPEAFSSKKNTNRGNAGGQSTLKLNHSSHYRAKKRRC